MRKWWWAVAALVAMGAAARRADLSHGKRIAQIEGCVSCHGAKLDGHLFEENPDFAIAWSSNLSRILPRRTDAQIERTLRTGRRPDGTALWFMPSFVHARLSAADMRDLIAWLRTVPPSGSDHPAIKRGPRFAAAVAQGMPDSAAQVTRLAGRAPADLGPAHARGRYLAQIACAECHGPALTGARVPGPGEPPDLTVAAAYDAAAFRSLLRTGKGIGGRDLGDMTRYGPERFVGLTDSDVAAIRAYLVARAR